MRSKLNYVPYQDMFQSYAPDWPTDTPMLLFMVFCVCMWVGVCGCCMCKGPFLLHRNCVAVPIYRKHLCRKSPQHHRISSENGCDTAQCSNIARVFSAATQRNYGVKRTLRVGVWGCGGGHHQNLARTITKYPHRGKTTLVDLFVLHESRTGPSPSWADYGRDSFFPQVCGVARSGPDLRIALNLEQTMSEKT